MIIIKQDFVNNVLSQAWFKHKDLQSGNYKDKSSQRKIKKKILKRRTFKIVSKISL